MSFNSSYEYAHEPGFEVEVKIAGEHWDGDHTHPLDLAFAGLWLGRAGLLELQQRLIEWVSKPLHELASARFTGEFELASLPGQSVYLTFGPRIDTIDERHPVLSARIKAGNTSAETHFVTDQSCISIFIDEMSEVMASLSK